MTDIVREQILKVRDTGRANMFDANAVQRIAFDCGWYELVNYLEEQRDVSFREYTAFILYGDSRTEQ